MRETDLDAVAAIATIGFPDHFEGRPCFANRLALYPSGCFVLAAADPSVIPSEAEGSRRASEKLNSPDDASGKPDGIPRLLPHPRDPLGMTAGYLIAYPWRADSAPALDTLLETLPADPAVIYLHDLALHPDARGAGHAATIVEALAEDARAGGWPALALVAVNNAAPFWQRHGFKIRDTPPLRAKLASYGPDACYMVRALRPATIG